MIDKYNTIIKTLSVRIFKLLTMVLAIIFVEISTMANVKYIKEVAATDFIKFPS